MLTKTWSAALNGLTPYTVEIEVNASEQGQETRVVIVGLPDAGVRESKERTWSALHTCGYFNPQGHTTISLAPADIRKSGASFDLPIAIGLIGASMKIPRDAFENTMLIGELSLDGSLRPAKGVLAMAIHARESGFKRILVPEMNAAEAAIAEGVEVFGINNLRQAVEFLTEKEYLRPTQCDLESLYHIDKVWQNDFMHVKGHVMVKRGLEIAAAGGHNTLMIGAPGCGKTLLANCFPSILPRLHLDEALKVTQIHSIAGTLPKNSSLITSRPFRSPHHTVSDAGLLGGSANPKPGEVSLANRGVLFLDELPEYKRSTLEVLRQPLESGEVTISRASGTSTFPANFMLLAAMNPCPCGHYGNSLRECRCGYGQIHKYRSKVSGPLLDRIDIHLEVAPINEDELMSKPNGEPSSAIRERVEKARKIQFKRFQGTGLFTNSEMSSQYLQKYCELDTAGQQILRVSINDLDLSARAYDRILRMARTIADIEGEEKILAHHIGESVQYRTLDRKLW